MKIGSIVKLLVISFMGLVLRACSENDNNPSTNPETPEVDKAIITCSTSELNFISENSSQTISFTANKEWSVQILGNVSWCTLSSTEGNAGTSTITVSVDKNSAYIDRNASIIIKCEEATHSIVVTQKQMDALLLSSSKYEISQEGGNIEINVKSNVDYELEIIGDSKNWIKESTSRSLKAYSHSFVISPNLSTQKREGEIHFRSGNLTETVKVYQEGTSNVLVLTQNEYMVSDMGEIITVEIKSNVDYGVVMPDVDWVKTDNNSRAMSTHTLRYIIEPNPTYDTRTADIIFYDKNNEELKQTLHIIQKQRNALILGSNKVEIGQTGGNVTIEVRANINYTMEIVDEYKSWVSETKSRALTTHNHTFTVAANETNASRTAEIRFYDNSRNLHESFFIIQAQKDVISVNKDLFEVNSQKNTIEVEIYSNIPYEVNISSTWIKPIESNRSAETKKLFFAIEENTGLERQAQISIINKDKGIQKVITVIQQKKTDESSKEDKDPEGKVEDMGWGK